MRLYQILAKGKVLPFVWPGHILITISCMECAFISWILHEPKSGKSKALVSPLFLIFLFQESRPTFTHIILKGANDIANCYVFSFLVLTSPENLKDRVYSIYCQQCDCHVIVSHIVVYCTLPRRYDAWYYSDMVTFCEIKFCVFL